MQPFLKGSWLWKQRDGQHSELETLAWAMQAGDHGTNTVRKPPRLPATGLRPFGMKPGVSRSARRREKKPSTFQVAMLRKITLRFKWLPLQELLLLLVITRPLLCLDFFLFFEKEKELVVGHTMSRGHTTALCWQTACLTNLQRRAELMSYWMFKAHIYTHTHTLGHTNTQTYTHRQRDTLVCDKFLFETED